jgi:prepilin-type N-terminal cleavage/methylation domain-containing protein
MNWRDDRGFSLTELLVVSVMLVFVLSMAWALMYATSSMGNSLSAGAVATDESQVFLDNIGREMRQADNLKSLAETSTSNADAQAAFSEILPRETTFYVDLYHLGGGHANKVQYYMSGSSLMRREWAATNTTYPYTWSGSPTKTSVVVTTVDSAWSGPIFTYYTDDTYPPTQITNVSQVASVTAVTVQVQDRQTWGGKTQSYGATMTVRVRAMDNKF